MPRFAANLSMMYPELPFLERFEAAARDGFTAVEFMFPYAWPAPELAARLAAHGLAQVLFNAPPGGSSLEAVVAGRPAARRRHPRRLARRLRGEPALGGTRGLPDLKVQMDLYHCQIVEGDLASKIRQYLPTGRIGHFQIAGVPERHEPDSGELNDRYLFELIDAVSATCGWAGCIGCEYRPRRGGEAGGMSGGLG